MKKLFKNKKILILVLVILFILIGGTFAYFSIQYNTDNKSATITGKAGDIGNTILTTNISKLYMNIDGRVMNPNKTGVTYYATTDESGEALESNPNYVLATISTTGKNALDCTYNYKITATVKNSITDGSDENITVTIGNVTKTLKEILDAGTDGIIISNNIMNLKNNKNKVIYISSTVTNTNTLQNDLQNNFYTINVEQYKDESGKALTCKLHDTSSLADTLIASGNLWQSGLEGDGYRFTGSYNTLCSYDNGNFAYPADNQSTTPTCPTIYKYTATRISDGYTWNSTYQTSCPSNTDSRTYSCTELTAESMVSPNVPNNFICFGTTDKDTCTSNPSTYMYRIIGVFADENEDNHIKLIKYTQLSSEYAWHSDGTVDVVWADSDLYKGLNGSYFLTNPTYSYMQDATWLSKITDWKWSAVNTKSYDDSYYYYASGKEIYLHEMNRSTKTSTIGEWTTPTAKIGLMYVSDYALSLGQTALLSTGYSDYSTLKTGWMHPSNNDTSADTYEWTMSCVDWSTSLYAWIVASDGCRYYYYDLNKDPVSYTHGVRPVLYLESEVKGEGVGSITDPIMLKIN